MVPGSRSLNQLAAAILLLALLAAGCTAPVYEPPIRTPVARTAPPAPAPPSSGGAPEVQVPQSVPAPAPEPVPPPPPPASSGATAALLQQSRQQSAAGDYAMATSSLERALRINPRDADLWLELGHLKLRQGDYVQAESMGQRALTVAGSDPVRREQCEALITAARQR